MGRRIRDDQSGAWYHVVNRGIARRTLFESRSDARYFLAKLARCVRAGQIEVHAYSLLTTHYHLLVRNTGGELSKVMQSVQTSYSRRFNRRSRRDGPLVRGRYFARRVHGLRYRRTVVRYIDANAVAARLAQHAWEYELCSAKSYARLEGPPWLERSWIESICRDETNARRYSPKAYVQVFGPRGPKRDAAIADFVDRQRYDAASLRVLDDLVGAAPDRVRAWMCRKAQLADGLPSGERLCSPQSVVAALEEMTRPGRLRPTEPSDRRNDLEPTVLVWLLRTICAESWQAIAERTGLTVGRARYRFDTYRRSLLHDEELQEWSERVLSSALWTCHG